MQKKGEAYSPKFFIMQKKVAWKSCNWHPQTNATSKKHGHDICTGKDTRREMECVVQPHPRQLGVVRGAPVQDVQHIEECTTGRGLLPGRFQRSLWREAYEEGKMFQAAHPSKLPGLQFCEHFQCQYARKRKNKPRAFCA